MKSLITGILISTSLTLFLYVGIALSCKYLLHVTLSLISIIIISSFIFWINIKHDYMSDLMNIISSTVAFDYRFSRPRHVISINRFLKRINPYIGLLATCSGLLLLSCTVPALIITVLSHTATSDKYIFLSAVLMSTGTCTAYFFSNKDQFTIVTSRISFFSGILMGTCGVYTIISSLSF